MRVRVSLWAPFNEVIMWRLWAKALGEKVGKNDREADRVAVIRSLIVLFYIITNCFIIAGVVHHW